MQSGSDEIQMQALAIVIIPRAWQFEVIASDGEWDHVSVSHLLYTTGYRGWDDICLSKVHFGMQRKPLSNFIQKRSEYGITEVLHLWKNMVTEYELPQE